MLIASDVICSGINTGPAAPGVLCLAQRRSIGHTIAGLPLLALQVLGLWALNLTAASGRSRRLQLGDPGQSGRHGGAVSAASSLGLVKASWFDVTGSFLIKHLAFFFVPITVGLMDAGSPFATNGVRDHPHTRGKRRDQGRACRMGFAAPSPQILRRGGHILTTAISTPRCDGFQVTC